MVYCATSFFTHMDVGIKLLTSRWQKEKFKIKVLLETDGLHLLQRLRKWQNYAELESHFVDIHFSSRNTRKQLHLTCTLTFLLALEMPLKDSSIKQNSSLLRWKMSLLQTTQMRFHSTSCGFENGKQICHLETEKPVFWRALMLTNFCS